MAEKQSGFPEHYREQFKGWANELEQSGWGEKFALAKKEGITKELIIEFQLEYLQELVKSLKPEDVKDFIRSVFKMRAWQKAYAERRTTYAKKEAERWENDVDKTLAEEKPKLFDN